MTIKETAGKILLYLYQLQRTVPSSMRNRQLGFIDKADGGVSLTSDKKWLTNDLTDINPVASDIYNGFTYLIDKGFIQSGERATKGARIYVGVQLGSDGIDIIESIERGADGREEFSRAFNIEVDGSANVEALIKDSLSTLLK